MRTHRNLKRAIESTLFAATTFSALAIAPLALAQEQLDEVVVSSTPLKKDPFDLAQSISVVEGEQLMLNARPSIGETLSSQPGINASTFGQGSSRPIIRGLGGDRVKVLQGGVGVQDVSNTSPDHAVALEPIQADRVEVVRGPATLMYGPNAIGGVVNVLDGRIAEKLPEGPASGALDLRGATVDGLRSAGARVDAPVGDFAIHLDGFYRGSDNYRIPGFARTSELRSEESDGDLGPRDKLPQSFTEAEGASIGASYIFEKGYFGVAGNLFNTTYGLPNSSDVSINMKQRRLDVRGRIDDAVPFLERIETRTGIVQYEHTEFEGEEVGTIFGNDGIDTRLELTHAALGPVKGMLGFQYQYSDFDAIGEEAFIPATRTNTVSGFIFEEYAASDTLSFQAGGRVDGNSTKTNQFRIEEDDSPESRSVSPTALSGSLGTIYKFLDGYAAAATVTHTERAATATELFANGPHFATGVFEIGDPSLRKERALGLDITLRKRSGWVTGFLSGYHNRFNNYITLFPTGQLREGGHHEEEGHGEDHDGDHLAHNDEHHDEEDHHGDSQKGEEHGSGEIPEYRFRAVDADYFGAEGQVVFHLFGPKEELEEDSETKQLARGISENRSAHDRNHLDLSAQADFVRAYVRNGGGNVPQTPPWRMLFAADYRRESFGARFEVQHVFEQEQVANFESETSGFTLVNAIFSHDFTIDTVPATGFLRFDNIFDEDARVHTSFIRNIAPLPGRNAIAGLRFQF